MNEEMRVEAMELCVTACEKHSSSNEVSSLFFSPNNNPALTFPSHTEELYLWIRRHKSILLYYLQAAAKLIKETMDKKFGAAWHVVVGMGFGFEINYEVKNILYMFFGGNTAICMWKCA